MIVCYYYYYVYRCVHSSDACALPILELQINMTSFWIQDSVLWQHAITAGNNLKNIAVMPMSGACIVDDVTVQCIRDSKNETIVCQLALSLLKKNRKKQIALLLLHQTRQIW